MVDSDLLAEISTKLNVLIALSLRHLTTDKDFSKKRRQGAGDLVRFLSEMGLEAKDISAITGSPITSVRTLLTPTRRK